MSTNKKKKDLQKAAQTMSFKEWSNYKNGIDEEDIAPIKTVAPKMSEARRQAILDRRVNDVVEAANDRLLSQKQKSSSVSTQQMLNVGKGPISEQKYNQLLEDAPLGIGKNKVTNYGAPLTNIAQGLYERANRIETTQAIFDKYGKYYNSPDFEEYSKQGAAIKNPTMKEAEGWASFFGHRLGAEDAGNIVTYSRDNADYIVMGELNGSKMVGKSKYRYMTDFEVGIYNYLLAKNGKDAAQEFLDDIEETLNAREGGMIAENIQNSGAVASTLLHGAASVSSGMKSFGIGIKQLFSEEALPTTSTEFMNMELLNDLDGFAEKAYQAGNTIGNMLPSMVAGYGNPVLYRILQGSSAAGSAYRQARQEGKPNDEAAAFGVMMGGMEYVTSSLLDGISGATGSLPKKALQKISTFSNALARVGAKYAISIGSEITEEELQLWLEPFVRKVAFGEDYDAPTIEEMADTAIITAISTGILNSGSDIATGNLTKVNGLTPHEATVINNVYEQRLAEESENRTLSKRDKDKLYDRVVEKVKRGYVSTDEIERILGGKTYEGYKSLIEKKNSLEERKTVIENEIKDLVKTPESQFTVEQREKLTSLREEAKGIKESLQNLGIKTAKNNLFNEVNKLTSKDTYLRESYNDLIRQTQDIQIDENQYKGTKFEDAAKKTIENARKAGASNSIKVRDFVEFSAKYSSVSGTVVDFKSDNEIKSMLEQQFNSQITKLSKSTTEADKAKLAKLQEKLKQVQEGEIKVNGVKTKDGVAININSSNYLNTVLGHEVTHFLENKEAYEALQKAAFKYAKTKGDYEGRREVLEALYDGIDGTSVDYELTADLVGDYLFTDYDFIKNLSTENRNVFQYVFDQIKYMYKLATAGSREARELEKVMHQFERALRESVETSQSNAKTQFSIKATEDGTKYVKLDGNIFLKEDGTEMSPSQAYNALVGQKITLEDGDVITFIKKLPDRNVYKELFKKLPGYEEGIDVKAVSESINKNIVEVITASEAQTRNEAQRHPHIGIKDFDQREVYIADESDAYRLELCIANLTDGSKIAYVKRYIERASQEIAEKIKKAETAEQIRLNQPLGGEDVETIDTTSTDNSIAPLSENVNTQFSLSADPKKADADYKFAVENGDTETAQKMVDDAARKSGYNSGLLYHGTSGFGFTQIDTSKSDDGISFFATDSLENAQTYSGQDNVKNIKDANREGAIDKLTKSYSNEVDNFAELVNKVAGVEDFVSKSDLNSYIKETEYNEGNFGAVADNLNNYVESIVNDLYENARKSDSTITKKAFYASKEVQAIYDASLGLYDILDNVNNYWLNSAGNYQLYANTEGLLEIDAEGNKWDEIPFEQSLVSTRELAKYAKAEGYNGVKVSNVYDDGGQGTRQSKPSTVYIFFNPQAQVKSADPVTYDADGNVIPLSERFNAENEDIRYSLSKSSLDNETDLVYNVSGNFERGDGYVRTVEFRKLQAESQRMSDEESKLYHSGSKQIDDEVRGRLSRTFGLELRSANSERIYSIRTLLNPKTNNNVNIYEGVDGSLFHDCFEISRKYLRNGELVDLHEVKTTEDGIGYDDCDNYLSEDGLSGFSITPDGDLISVFNLNAEKGFLKTIAPLVKEKAKTLDCYASPNQNLMAMYEKIFGFKTAAVMDYNMEYDHDDIAQNHNMPKVAFMVNTESDVETKYFTKDEYDEAKAYRDSFVNQATDNDIAPTENFSLSYEGANRTPGGSYRFDGKDFRVKSEQDIAPVAEGDTPKTYGNYNIFGNDVMLESTPTQESVTTPQEDVAEETPIQEEVAPIMEAPIAETAKPKKRKPATAAEVNQQGVESIEHIADDFAPVVETAPVAETPAKEAYEAIRPPRKAEQVAEPSMTEAEPRMKRADSKNTAPDGMEERSWYETSTESKAVDGIITPDDIPDDVRYYQVKSNKKSLETANNRLARDGYAKSREYFEGRMTDKKLAVEDIALGERLIQEAAKAGDAKAVRDLIIDVSILGTELGQRVQALSMIRRLTPEGQLKALIRTVERGKAKGDKAFEGVEVTEDMTKRITDTIKEDGTFDQAELDRAVEDVKQQIADQMPVGALDYINAWRYLSMLGNPKTHIRNVVSNIAMLGTRTVKNAVARTIETIAPIKNRTKTWMPATKAVKNFAKTTTTEMETAIKGDNKYSDESSIKAKRKIFKTPVGNALADFNTNSMELEDAVFSKQAFRATLQEYLTANGIKTEEDIKNNPQIVEKAKDYALDEAKRATFRQDSFLANKIAEIEKKNPLSGIAVGSIMPFKKTPINVAKTGAAYSPLGFARNVYDAVKVAKGEMDASEAIDHLAQTITGTGLALIGYALAESGILNGAGDDDKEGKYDYQLGKQSYSFTFNGDTYSLNWLSPVAMPLFVGANAYETLVEKNEWDANVVIDTLGQTLDPLSEMSFLSSLDDVLSSYDSGIAKFWGAGESMVQNYATQFVPTLLSQVAAVTDDTKRSTRASGDSGFTFGEETLNKIKYKIPGLRQTLEPTTDIWGNEYKQTEDGLTRAFESFLSPANKRENIATDVDDELKAMYGEVGESELLPSIPYGYVNYKDVKYDMSAEDYTEYKKTYGQTAYDLMESLFDTDTYKNASTDEKADMIADVYDYARDAAKKEYFTKNGVDYTNATKDDKEVFKENPIKGAIEADMSVDEYVFSQEYPEKYEIAKAVGGYDAYKRYKSDMGDMKLAEKAEYIAGLNLTTAQKNALINGETDRKEPIDLSGYSTSTYSSFEEFEYAKANPGKFVMSKAISDDFLEYYNLRSTMEAFDAKDENGETVSGLKKERVTEYINGLDLDYGQRLILYRSMYSSKEDRNNYNADIVEYLNSRDDISYEEMVAILKELDMTVDANGNVDWD